MLKVYILILNYKRWEETAECLKALFQSTYTHFTAIVIDNHSENQSLEHLAEWLQENKNIPTNKYSKPLVHQCYKERCLTTEILSVSTSQLMLIQNNTNKGFAAGINTVLKYLINESAFVWLLNPDVVVEPSTLAELVNFAQLQSGNSIIGCVLKEYANPDKIHTYGGGKIRFQSATVRFITNKKEAIDLDYISGGALFTQANTYKRLGLLPEDYFLYWEETDWCYRAKMQGCKLLVCEAATCYDKISTSIGKNYLSDFYYTRNGLIFISKFKNAGISITVFFIMLRLVKRVATGQWNRAKGMYEGLNAFFKLNAN